MTEHLSKKHWAILVCKVVLISVALCACPRPSPSGPGTDEVSVWLAVVGTTGHLSSPSAVPLADGGFMVGSHFSNSTTTSTLYDPALTKVTKDGLDVWTRTHSTANNETIYDIATTSDSGFVLAGVQTDASSLVRSAYVTKFNSDGGSVWDRTFGPSGGYTVLNAIIALSDGSLVATGWTSATSGHDNDVYLVKLDSNGSIVWEKTFGGSGTDIGEDLLEASNGDLVIAGWTASSGAGKEDMYLLRTDSAGTLLWQHSFGGADYDVATAITKGSDGGFFLVGYTYSSFAVGITSFYAVKTDDSGNQEWASVMGSGGSGTEYAEAAAVGKDGGYVVVGHTDSGAMSGQNIYAVKFSQTGSVVWEKVFGTNNTDNAHDVVACDDGGFLIVGDTGGSGLSNQLYLIKIDADGKGPEAAS